VSSERSTLSPAIQERLRNAALLALDFDGVLTDDRVIVHDDGHEAVVCSRSDGMGIALLRAAGLPMVILSSETNPVVTHRAAKLGVPVAQGLTDKLAALYAVCDEQGIAADRVIFVGNDVNDRGCLAAAGVAVVPADAHPMARRDADIVLRRAGGRGAVRELADAILAAKSDLVSVVGGET
jgi:YrbI family 3-deoxy-D-manno-octulosonate 8-phosphate phosphatase